jgi:gas vesicle protein
MLSNCGEIYRNIFLCSSLFFIGYGGKITKWLDNKRMRRKYRMSKSKSILVGFALGTIVTAAATLLSTPKAGKEVRKDLKDNMVKMRSTLSNIKREGIQLKEKIHFAKKEKEETLQETAASVDELMEDDRVEKTK